MSQMPEKQVSRGLKEAWHRFIAAPSRSRELQSQLLDIFLVKLIVEYQDVPSSVQLTEWISAGNVLAHQLMLEVHEACSGDDPAPCREFLLSGRGWKLLWALVRIGSQSLPCCKELSRVAISLLAFFSKLEEPWSPGTFEWEFEERDLMACSVTPASPTKTSLKHRRCRQKPQAESASDSSDSTDSEQMEVPSPLLLRTSTALFLSNKDPLDSASEGWEDRLDPRRSAPLEEALTDKETKVASARVAPSFLLHCLVTLLTQSCRGAVHKGDRWQAIATSISGLCLPGALELFNSLSHSPQGGSQLKQLLGQPSSKSLQRRVLRLIITATSQLLHSGCGYSHQSIRKYRVLSTLLDTCQPALDAGDSESVVESMCAALIFIRDAIRSFPSSEGSLNWVVEAVHRLCSHSSLQATLCSSDRSSCLTISSLLADIVLSLKRAKTARRQGIAFHHHDALLGTQLRHSMSELSSGCCIASLSSVLLNAPFLSTQALSRCGICCCMALDEVFVPLLSDFGSRPEEEKQQILQLLQKCLCAQLGLFSHACFTCRERQDRGEGTCVTYSSLLNHGDADIQASVGRHLLAVVEAARSPFRELICMQVALPCFLEFDFANAVNAEPELNPLWFSVSAFSLLGADASSVFLPDSLQMKLLYQLLAPAVAPVYRHAALVLIETLILAYVNTVKEEDDSGSTENSLLQPLVDGESNALSAFTQFLATETKEFLRKVRPLITMQSIESLNESVTEESTNVEVATHQEAQLSTLAELWSSCRRVAQCSVVRSHLRTGSCCAEAYRLLLWLVDETVQAGPCSRKVFPALETLLALLLQLCPVRLWHQSECLQRKELVRELRNRLHGCPSVNRTAAEWRCLLDALLGNLVHWTRVPTFSSRPKVDSSLVSRAALLRHESSSTSLLPEADEGLGYEADSESSLDDYATSDGALSMSREAGDVSVVCYEEVCSLVLDLVCRLCPNRTDVALHAIQRLTTLCSQHPLLLTLFVKQGAVGKLCHGLGCLLHLPDQPDLIEHHTLELQESLVSLLVLFCRRSLSSQDLVSYMGLLKGAQSAFGPILQGLLALANCGDRGPQCWLQFPPLAADDDDEVLLLPSAQEVQEEGDGHFAELPHGGASNQAVLVLPLVDHGGWCPRREGFSLSFWLALRWSSVLGHEGSSRLHLVSLGCGPFLCELWAEDVEKGTVSLWLTQGGAAGVAEGAACNAASQCSFERALAGHGWHHLALAYHEHVPRGGASETSSYASVTVTVDGRHSRSWHLPLEGQGRDSCSHQPGPMLLIGQGTDTTTSIAVVNGGISWNLGNLLLFRGSCLGSAECLALYSRGADAVAPTSCLLDEDEESTRVDISPGLIRKGSLKKKWLAAGQVHEVMATLEGELMLWFSPQRSDSYVSYPHASQAFPSFLGTPKKRKRNGPPRSQAARRLSPVQVQWERQLHHAAASLGGPGLFLFLLARVVECTTDDGPQAAALELVLGMLGQPSATWGSPRILVGASEALNLLGQLVEHPRWAADSPRCLLVAVNACSSRPLLQWDGEGSVEAVRHPTGQEPLLVWPQLVSTLLEHWRPGPGRRRLLAAAWALLRERHPHREHNLMQAAPILGSLLASLRRLLVDDSQVTLGPSGTLPLVLKLLGALVPATGELAQRLSACLDLLLLLHRAANAHVAQARSAFYSLPPQDCAPASTGFSIVETSRATASSLSSSPLSGSFGHLLGMVSRSPANEAVRKAKEPDVPKAVKVVPTATPAQLYSSLDGNSLVDANLASVHGELPCPALAKPGPKPTATEALSLLFSGEMEASSQSHIRSLDQSRASCPFESSIRRPMTSSPVPLSPNPWVEMDEEPSEVEDDMTGLVLGLLKLLQDILVAAPENVVREKLEPVVRLEALLILAHNENALVRNQVLCVLEAYLSKASSDSEARFLKSRGFQLLGLQLAQYPATAALVQSCCRILLGRPLYLARKIPRGSLPDQASNRASVTLLLSLLPRTVHDAVLCCGTLSLLRQLCDNVEGAARLLYSNGLGESLATTIVAAPRALFLSRSLGGEHGDGFVDLILALVRSASLATSRLAMEQTGKISMECFHSLCSLFARLSEAHNTRCGENCKAVPVFRECQAQLYISALELLVGFCTEEKRSQSSPSLLEAFTSLPTQQLVPDVAPLSPDVHQGARHVHYSDTNGPLRDHVMPSMSSLSRELGSWFVYACDFVIYQELSSKRPPSELSLVAVLLKKAVAATALGHLSKKSKRKLSSPEKVLSSLKHVFQPQLSRLCVNLLAPDQDSGLRVHVAEVLMSCEHHRQALKVTLGSSSDVRLQVRTFVQEMLGTSASRSDANASSAVVSLVAVLAQELPSVLPRNPRQDVQLDDDQIKERWLNQWTTQRDAWLLQNTFGSDRKNGRLRKLEAKASQVVAEGAKVTRSVAELLHALRKEVLREAKARSGRELVLKQTWSRLAAQLTHERAPWHLPESFPTSWELDPTEGPSRVRRRLRRAFLAVDPKFMLPEHQKSQKTALPPLHFLYDTNTSHMESTAFLHHLYINERITHTCKCSKICPSSDMSGEVLLGEKSLQFVPDQLGKFQGSLGEVDARHEVWPYKDVQEVLLRRFRLRDNAVELFLRNGVTALLAFHTTQDRNEFCRQLWQCPHLDLEPSESLESLSHRWQERYLGNFDYLTQLNKLAGRSFNDLMQYPVFPFVLAKYAEDTLDLRDAASFRCLERPMAVQDPAREEHYRRNFRAGSANTSMERLHPWLGPYHYGSHYSNSGSVLHFLVRLPPFTQMFLTYQDKQFDLPDRTFHSMHTTWRLASSESTTDVKELIPEFFFLPEFLVNMQGFDFGKRQTGELVSDVQLPPWCRGDPRLFILIHRQVLESDYVTEHLGHWIDLVFGYKQTGKAAEEAINVFHPATYYGVDVSSVTHDVVSQRALETMIRTYGQMPKQLFSSPHPLVTLSLAESQRNAAGPASSQVAMAEVRGLRWGSYVGSPSEPPPRLVLRRFTQKDQGPVSQLASLRTNDVWGLPAHSCLLLTYSQSSGGSKAALQTYIQSTALVSWQHADSFVRLKVQKDEPAQPLLSPCPGDMVSTCAAAPGSPLVFVGYASGLLTAHEIKLNNSKVEHSSQPTCLLGHTDAVTRIEICVAFGLVVTTSRDGSCIAWDLNRLEYVRTVVRGNSPIVLACISSTLGDIATVQAAEGSRGSCLQVHTINGARVGQLSTEVVIEAICYSAAPEGTSINVLAAGCADGRIRLWSSWDLSPVQDISSDKCVFPIISLAYSQDQQHLYAVDSQGDVYAWEANDSSRVPRFHVLL